MPHFESQLGLSMSVQHSPANLSIFSYDKHYRADIIIYGKGTDFVHLHPMTAIFPYPMKKMAAVLNNRANMLVECERRKRSACFRFTVSQWC